MERLPIPSFAFRSIGRCALFAATAALVSCATYLGDTIEVPEIPAPEAPAEGRARLNTSVTVSGFKDVRDSIVANKAAGEEKFTEPQGNTTGEVENAVREAMRLKGISPDGGRLNLWGEIRKWRTNTRTTTTNTINSEASLYVELLDSAGKRLYSGTFHGTRSSVTPLAKASDIKNSLGLAMAQAIDQMLQDEEFLGAILKNAY